jgi:hypothetical protein
VTVKLNQKEKNNLRKKKQIEVNEHLEKAVIAISDMTPHNSFPLSELLLQLQMTLLRLEKKQILFNKAFKGKRRLYKKFTCRRGLDAWRKCPEPRCVAFAYGMDLECPYEEPVISRLWGT